MREQDKDGDGQSAYLSLAYFGDTEMCRSALVEHCDLMLDDSRAELI